MNNQLKKLKESNKNNKEEKTNEELIKLLSDKEILKDSYLKQELNQLKQKIKMLNYYTLF